MKASSKIKDNLCNERHNNIRTTMRYVPRFSWVAAMRDPATERVTIKTRNNKAVILIDTSIHLDTGERDRWRPIRVLSRYFRIPDSRSACRTTRTRETGFSRASTESKRFPDNWPKHARLPRFSCRSLDKPYGTRTVALTHRVSYRRTQAHNHSAYDALRGRNSYPLITNEKESGIRAYAVRDRVYWNRSIFQRIIIAISLSFVLVIFCIANISMRVIFSPFS